MRRIASVFRKSSTRLESSDPASNVHEDLSPVPPAPSAKRTASRKSQPSAPITVSTARPPPVPSTQGSSSTSSCTDSLVLRTPEDDGLSSRLPSPAPNTAKKAWISSVFGKKAERSSPAQKVDVRKAFDAASAAQTPASLQPPRPLQTSFSSQDSDDDETSESDEDDYDRDDTPRRPGTTKQSTSSPNTSSSARHLRAFIIISLAPPISPPPLLHLPGMPLFPRSSNSPSSLPRAESLSTRMHKTRLVHRLDRYPLSPSEQRSITGFASKHGPKRPRSPYLKEAAFSTKRIRSYSEGLLRWSQRPCFENRVVLWSPGPDGLASSRISGRPGFAVAALELSEALEILAGLDEDRQPMDEPLSPESASSSTSQLSLSTASRNATYRNGPSPLRIEHIPSDEPKPIKATTSSSTIPRASPSSSSSTATLPASRSAQSASTVVNDDPSENIPLGYALKARKAKQDKARFLQEQRERRAHDEERKKMDHERQAWEQEKQKWEKEKRAIEEERRQKKISEDVIAARQRQSGQRSGVVPTISAGWVPERKNPERGASATTVSRSKDFEVISPRRQASEPVVMTMSGLRPQSIASGHSPSTISPSSPWPHSPFSSSPHSSRFSSSEDVRSASMSKATKRTSMASTTSTTKKRMSMTSVTADAMADRGRSRSRRSSVHSNSNSPARPISVNLMNIPPVPAMPIMMMPGLVYTAAPVQEALLPPAAPFMMQHYGPQRSSSRESDRRSRNSSSNSPARATTPSSSSKGSLQQRPGPGVLPTSQSTDRVHLSSSHERRRSDQSQKAPPRSYSFQDPRMSMVMAPGYGVPMAAAPAPGWGMPMSPAAFIPMAGPQPMLGRPLPSATSNRQSVIF